MVANGTSSTLSVRSLLVWCWLTLFIPLFFTLPRSMTFLSCRVGFTFLFMIRNIFIDTHGRSSTNISTIECTPYNFLSGLSSWHSPSWPYSSWCTPMLKSWSTWESKHFLFSMVIQILSSSSWWWLFHSLLTLYNTGSKTVFSRELNSFKIRKRMLRRENMKWNKFIWTRKVSQISRETERAIGKIRELKISTRLS